MDRPTIARVMIKFGGPLRPLALMVMKTDQLAEFGRQCYDQSSAPDNWSDEQVLEQGLVEEERALLKMSGKDSGRALVLGVGGGRDAIALAKLGFQTVGVDYVSTMVYRARCNAEKRGVALELAVQEISRLGFAGSSFDMVFFSSAMYSCIPTRKRRVDMLSDIHKILKADGFMLCQFFWRASQPSIWVMEKIKKLSATLTGGYKEYEYGDFLRGGVEFLHGFYDKKMLMAEFRENGFQIQAFTIFKNGFFGAVLLKRTE